VAVLPELLERDARIGRELDRANRARLTIAIGGLRIEVLLQDDTAKLPLPLVYESVGTKRIPETMRALEAGTHPPALHARLASELRWAGCLDDLFADATDDKLFGTPNGPTVWAHYLTPLGRVVHAYRAAPAVLEAALTDLQAGLGQRLAQRRNAQENRDVDELLASIELPEPLRRACRRRLTSETRRYSLLIRTALAGDVRQRFVICTANEPPQVLVNWEIAP
jgi:hypothetical protein